MVDSPLMGTLVRRRTLLASALLGPPLLAACSKPSTTPLAAMGPASADVRVGLLDYYFRRSAKELLATTVRMTVTNAGSTPHDLKVLDGERVLMATRVLAAGEQEQISGDLSGMRSVTFLCTVPGPRAR